jgi:hypothetical protein
VFCMVHERIKFWKTKRQLNSVLSVFQYYKLLGRSDFV